MKTKQNRLIQSMTHKTSSSITSFSIMGALTLLLVMISCSSSEDLGEKLASQETRVNISISPFTILTDDIDANSEAFPYTRAGLEGKAPTMLSIAVFDANDSLVFCTHQASTDSAFCQASTTLKTGSYTLVAVGYNDSVAANISSLEKVSFSSYVKDTYCLSKTFSVTNSGSADISASLDRAVAKFTVKLQDFIPADIKYMSVSYSKGGDLLNPSTALSIDDDGCVRNYTLPDEYVGSTTKSFSLSSYLFLGVSPEVMDITVRAMDVDGVVRFSHTLTGVQMERNKIVVASGRLFSGGTVGTFSFNTSWTDSSEVGW